MSGLFLAFTFYGEQNDNISKKMFFIISPDTLPNINRR